MSRSYTSPPPSASMVCSGTALFCFNIAELDRRFRDAYCLHHQIMDSVRTSETSVYFSETTSQKAVIFRTNGIQEGRKKEWQLGTA
jgi:hypothetical protein